MRKRAFDVAVICLAAIVWVPVVLTAALAVLVFSGRPIFYRSHRWVGPRQAIEMVKLRVMVPDANKVTAPIDAGRFLNTPPDSPLYTTVGRWLDRLGLNEIPQFVHVLRGHMSIVGARPLTDGVRSCLLDQHPTLDDRWRHSPAGLTGLPQLVGRMSLTDAERLELEAAYAHSVHHHYSVVRDFKILLHTVMITFGLRQALSYHDAIALVQPRRRRSTVRELATQRYAPAPDADVA